MLVESQSDDEEVVILDCSIYAMMEPTIAYKKLQLEYERLRQEEIIPGVLWLLRESRQEGCLTVDYLDLNKKAGSMRFALIMEAPNQAAKWLKVNDEKVLKKYIDEDKLLFMNMHTYYEKSKKSFCNELFAQLEGYGFLAEGYLEPTRQEQSRNTQYSSISKLTFINHKLKTQSTDTVQPELSAMLEQVKIELEQKKEELCPISFNSLQDSSAIAIVPQGEKFEKQALLTWLANNPSCPITRAPLNNENLLVSNAPEKTKRKLKEVEELMVKREEAQTDEPKKKKEKLSPLI